MFLGNLSISDLERRTGWTFSESDKKWLESHRQDNATVKFDSERFHIFDLPFTITVAEGIKDNLIKMLTKYNDKQASKDAVQIAVVTETDKEKETRLKKEKEEKEWQDKLNNPKAIWNVKWHMLVPVKAKSIETGSERDLYYGCFINTYTTGHNNIPDTIAGVANIYLNEEGLHGNFMLDNSERDSDADDHLDDWAFVIGTGYYSMTGNYLGKDRGTTFENTLFNLREAIELYKSFGKCSKEVHFDKIKET